MKKFFVILVIFAISSFGSRVKSPRHLPRSSIAIESQPIFEFTNDPPDVAANEPVFASPQERRFFLKSLTELCKLHYKSTETLFFTIFYDQDYGAQAFIKEAFNMEEMNSERKMVEKEEYSILCGAMIKTLKILDFLYFYLEDHQKDNKLSLLNVAMELYMAYMSSFQSLRSHIVRLMNVFFETNTAESRAQRGKLLKFYLAHLRIDFEESVIEALKSNQKTKEIDGHFMTLTNFDEMDRLFEDYKAMINGMVPMNADATVYMLRLELCMHELVSFQSLLRLFLDDENILKWKGLRTFLPKRWYIDRNYAILNNLKFPYYTITGFISSMMKKQVFIMGQNFRTQPENFKATSFEDIRKYLRGLDISYGDYPPIFTKLNEEKLKGMTSISVGRSVAKGVFNARPLQAKKENTGAIAGGKTSGDQKGKTVPQPRARKAKQMASKKSGKKSGKITESKETSDQAGNDENAAPLVKEAGEGIIEEIEEKVEEETSPTKVEQETSPKNVEQETSPKNVEQQPSPQNVEQQPSPQNVEQEPSPQNVAKSDMKPVDGAEEVEDLTQYYEHWRKYLKHEERPRLHVKEDKPAINLKQETKNSKKENLERSKESTLTKETVKPQTPRLENHFKEDDEFSDESHETLCKLLGVRKGTVEFPEVLHLFRELGVRQVCHREGSIWVIGFPKAKYRLDDTHGEKLRKWFKGHIVRILRLEFEQLRNYRNKCSA